MEIEKLKEERSKDIDKLIELGNYIAKLEELTDDSKLELLINKKIIELKKELKSVRHKNMQLTKDNKNHINRILTLKNQMDQNEK